MDAERTEGQLPPVEGEVKQANVEGEGEVKQVDVEAQFAEGEVKQAADNAQPVEAEAQPVEAEAQPVEAEAQSVEAEQPCDILVPGVAVIRDEATDNGHILELVAIDDDNIEQLMSASVRAAGYNRVRKSNMSLGFHKDYREQRDLGRTMEIKGVMTKMDTLVRVLRFLSTVI